MAQYSDANFAGFVEELTARSLADQMRTAQRYRDLLGQVAAGDLDAAALREQHDRLLADHQAQLARDIAALGVSYYQSILELNRAYVDRLFEQLTVAARATHRKPAGQEEPSPDSKRGAVEIHLRGRPGDRVEASFTVENHLAEPAEVVFYASEFAGADGQAFRVPLELKPPSLLLAAHTECRVTLAIALDSASFRPGSLYRARILGRGGDEFELHLTVEVEDEETHMETSRSS